MILSWGSLGRLLRRRLVLGVIFGLSLTYCAISLLSHDKMESKPMFDDEADYNMLVDNEDLPPDDIDDEGKNFQYSGFVVPDEGNDLTNIQSVTSSNDVDINLKNCRNSVQGKALIVDELGFVCMRQDVLSTGCCKNQHENTTVNEEQSTIKRERYSCETCNPQGCCAIYEYCVSCCLHPAKRRPKKDFLGLHGRAEIQKMRKIEDVIKLRFRNLDRFQLCLAVCRTSSASVRHENTYKDPDSKHCYITVSGNVPHQSSDRDIINNNGDKSVVTPFSTVSSFILHESSCPLACCSINETLLLFYCVLINSAIKLGN